MRDLQAMLLNWARWCRESEPRGRCMSIEHRYRSPQWGHWDSTPPAIQTPLNVLEAQMVEDAIKGMAEVHRDALRLYYVKRWPGYRIEKKLNWLNWLELHALSLSALNYSLTNAEHKRLMLHTTKHHAPESRVLSAA